MSDIKEVLKQQISQNNILIFMKGTPYEPQCGFSAKTVQALIECGVEFSFVDVLDDLSQLLVMNIFLLILLIVGLN